MTIESQKQQRRPRTLNRRDQRLTVVFSAEEREAIDKTCAELDVTFSSFARRLVLDKLAEIKAAKGGEK